ncbi:hypothetical protein P5704_023965 (plasmid) [Pseudomonas sp. FeN3W]|nr:hypothetical protein P5704_023965 [Pseudomonas sp. FeN3W]
MGLKSIPDSAQEEIYQFIQLALSPEEMIKGLAEDYSQNATVSVDGRVEVDEFIELLREMSPSSLSDVFFETVILNDRYDSQDSCFFIDKNCTKSYRTDELLGVFFKQALARIADVENVPVDEKKLKALANQVREGIVSGKQRMNLSLGHISLDLQAAKGIVKLSSTLGDVSIDEIDKRSLCTALKQWHHRIKGCDINVANDEAYVP